MGALGLLGMHLSGYGCAGTSAVAYGLACLELEAGDSGARSFVSVQGSLAMFPIWKFGSEEQKQEWLPAHGGRRGGGLLRADRTRFGQRPGLACAPGPAATATTGSWTAPRCGSPTAASPMWPSSGPGPTPTDGGPGPIHGFVVPTDTPGFQANDIHKKLSLRASVTSELVLTGVRLPDSARLPEVATMRGPLSCLNEARYGILWGATGAGRACYEAALAYAVERRQFDRPIASFQLTQRKLVEMMVRVNKSQLVALHLGRMKDQGRLWSAQVSFGKMDNVREALWIAREARSVLGANGITLEYPVIRHMNNLESVFTYEGTNEIHTLVLGQAITGISAFS